MDWMRPPLPSSSPEQEEFEIRWHIDLFYQNQSIISELRFLPWKSTRSLERWQASLAVEEERPVEIFSGTVAGRENEFVEVWLS